MRLCSARWTHLEEREKTYLTSSKSWVGKILGSTEAAVFTVQESSALTALSLSKKWLWGNTLTCMVLRHNPTSIMKTISISHFSRTLINLTKRRLEIQLQTLLKLLYSALRRKNNRQITWNSNCKSLSMRISVGLSMRTWYAHANMQSPSQRKRLRGRVLTCSKTTRSQLMIALDNSALQRSSLIRTLGFVVDARCTSRLLRNSRSLRAHPYSWLT